jgi:HprK-related kinase A
VLPLAGPIVDVRLDIGPFSARVRSDVPGFGTHLDTLYPDFPRHPPAEGHFDVAVAATPGLRRWIRPQATLVANGARPYLPVPADLAGPVMEWGLNWCIGTRMHRWVVAHAAVLERRGRVLILPAPPGSGKSTLCAALMWSGWRLFSDEFALIDPDTRLVSPVPRPVSLKNQSIAIVRSRYPQSVFSAPRIDTEGATFVHARPPVEAVRRMREPAAPGWLILPRYRAGAPTSIVPIDKAQALIELADQSFNYNFLGARGYGVLVDVVTRSACFRLEYSDLDDVLERLARMTDA